MRVKRWILSLGLFGVALAGLGAADAARTHDFRVTGMDCALCAPAIERSVQELPGVVRVSVDREAERVQVVASQEVEPQKLEHAIEAAGHFEAELLESR